MISIYVSLLVCIIGLVVYALASGKSSELGRIGFAVGLLVTLLSLGHMAVRFP